MYPNRSCPNMIVYHKSCHRIINMCKTLNGSFSVNLCLFSVNNSWYITYLTTVSTVPRQILTATLKMSNNSGFIVIRRKSLYSYSEISLEYSKPLTSRRRRCIYSFFLKVIYCHPIRIRNIHLTLFLPIIQFLFRFQQSFTTSSFEKWTLMYLQK